MEHHRLQPMKPGYDPILFEQLYKATAPLRKKLAYQIDARKFGVDYKEVLSWFDVKFIFAFNKYWDKEPKRLLGYIISALSMYKNRVMRSSYQIKYHTHAHMLDVDTMFNEVPDEGGNIIPHRNEYYMVHVMDFMTKKLSNDALLVLDIELNPPPFITAYLKEEKIKDTAKIPLDILAEYIGLTPTDQTLDYLKDVRSEIKRATVEAAKHFSENPIKEFAPSEF